MGKVRFLRLDSRGGTAGAGPTAAVQRIVCLLVLQVSVVVKAAACWRFTLGFARLPTILLLRKAVSRDDFIISLRSACLLH